MKGITIGRSYDALAVPGSLQGKITDNGKRAIAVDFEFTDDDGNVTQRTSQMWLEGGAKQYTLERLEVCGWDRATPLGPNTPLPNRIDLNAKEDVNEETGATSIVFEIRTGGGTFKFKNAVSEQQLASFGAELLEAGSGLSQRGGAPKTWGGAKGPTNTAKAEGLDLSDD